MTPTHAAALAIARDSVRMFTELVESLPDEALEWRPPLAQSNSIAVLATHAATSTRFWLGLGAGEDSSLVAYRAERRSPSFGVESATGSQLVSLFESTLAESEVVLWGGTAAHLERRLAWPEDPAVTQTGAEALFRAVGHLREHLGHAQVIRDLWESRDQRPE